METGGFEAHLPETWRRIDGRSLSLSLLPRFPKGTRECVRPRNENIKNDEGESVVDIATGWGLTKKQGGGEGKHFCALAQKTPIQNGWSQVSLTVALWCDCFVFVFCCCEFVCCCIEKKVLLVGCYSFGAGQNQKPNQKCITNPDTPSKLFVSRETTLSCSESYRRGIVSQSCSLRCTTDPPFRRSQK